MDQTDLYATLASRFRDTGRAHKEAFAEVDGHDPDWPIWYAERLVEPVNALLGRRLTIRELGRFLAAADHAHRAEAPDADWPGYYAEYLIELYAPELPD